MKKIMELQEFKGLLHDGMTLLVGGFMSAGTSETLIDAVVESGVKNLHIVCNDGGYENKGVGKLIGSGQVDRLTASHVGLNPMVGKKMADGSLDVTLVPQGSLAEMIRSGGAGLGGVLTPTGIGTVVEEGKQVIEIKGKSYILEEAIRGDLAIVLGYQVDEMGNVAYKGTSRNFNPLMATAADVVVVAAKEVVEKGALNPECIVTPHPLVDHIVKEV